MQSAGRRCPWKPWKREPPQERPITGTVTLNKLSGDTYTKPPRREGGEGARIRNDSQEGKN